MTLSYSAMSPATNTPETSVSSSELARTPPFSPSASPALRARVTSGTTPAPITTVSASSVRPDSVTTHLTRPSAPSKRASESSP